MLLLKQDRLSLLERRLEKIDREEVALLSLGSSRDDSNSERISVLAEIDAALADYGTPVMAGHKRGADNDTDALIERNHRILSLADASRRDVASLQNWVDGNGCIARQETAYLARAEDLLSVASAGDGATTWLEVLVEGCRILLHGYIGQVRNLHLSFCQDANT